MGSELFKLYPYNVPKWANHLKNIPSCIVKLSNLNTPVHRWNLPGLPEGVEISVKRDDLTGTALSGNKVRALQILFAEAVEDGATHVVTGGPPQSGHCRAVAIVCRLLGIKPHILVASVEIIEEVGSFGNALLSRMAGSKLYVAPGTSYSSAERRIEKISQFVRDAYKEKCYTIPIGGSTVKALFAFISLFEELLDQGLQERFDDIVLPVASGSTCLGIAVANYLTGSKLKVHAVSVLRGREDIYKDLDGLLQKLGLYSVKTEDILDVIEGYIGEGYGKATDELLRFITKVSSTTGIILDPYFTSKGAMGMVGELVKTPSRFKGKRILFIHTGGIFGLFNGVMDRVLHEENSVTNDITFWPDENVSPMETKT